MKKRQLAVLAVFLVLVAAVSTWTALSVNRTVVARSTDTALKVIPSKQSGNSHPSQAQKTTTPITHESVAKPASTSSASTPATPKATPAIDTTRTGAQSSDTQPQPQTTNNLTQTPQPKPAPTCSNPDGILADGCYPSQWALAPIDTVTDTWGQLNRESTSYTAWKVNQVYGDMPDGWGNATLWPSEAAALGLHMSDKPSVGTVAIDRANSHGASNYGFSAWVESVNGNQVTVSEYNWRDDGGYSIRTVPYIDFDVYISFAN